MYVGQMSVGQMYVSQMIVSQMFVSQMFVSQMFVSQMSVIDNKVGQRLCWLNVCRTKGFLANDVSPSILNKRIGTKSTTCGPYYKFFYCRNYQNDLRLQVTKFYCCNYRCFYRCRNQYCVGLYCCKAIKVIIYGHQRQLRSVKAGKLLINYVLN
jgi:hypothetical protein